MKKAFIGIALVVGMFFRPTAIAAVTTPEFPTCSAPSGELIASYDEGIHGIVGESGEFRGKDKVYKVNDAQVLQCFCPKDEGQGIQTLWWKFENISQDDQSILENQGWIYVPTGRVWGLADAPYLTRNTRFDCKNISASSNGTGGVGGGILGINSFAATGSQQFFLLLGTIAMGTVFFWLVRKAK